MRITRPTRFAVVAALAITAACGTDYFSGPTGPTDIDKDTYNAALGINVATMTKTADGIYYTDKTAGAGVPAVSGDSVRVLYTGYLSNGATFDTNRGVAGDTTNLRFRLGGNNILQGFSKGITGMKVGGRRLFIIPTALAYNTTPPPGSGIPRYANLIFDVDLVAKY